MNKLIRSGKPVLIIFLAATTIFLAVTGVSAADAVQVRVKDIVRVQGVRDNQLYGLGLVIGLNGTGDGTGALANLQMIANMLEKFGITVSAEDLRLRNVAAVMVTADIQSSVRVGDRIDVTVSSIGDAKSLQGVFTADTASRCQWRYLCRSTRFAFHRRFCSKRWFKFSTAKSYNRCYGTKRSHCRTGNTAEYYCRRRQT